MPPHLSSYPSLPSYSFSLSIVRWRHISMVYFFSFWLGSALQARLLEISDSLSADELKRMKFLVRGKVSGFRLAKIREGFELFEELETEGNYPCTYIGQLLERVQRCDLLEKLGLPVPDDAKSGKKHTVYVHDRT